MSIAAIVLLAIFGPGLSDTPEPTAVEIMHRVAKNQDREQKARNEFVYEQKMHRITRDKNGKLLKEEFWTWSVIPGPVKTEKKLISVKGRYWKKGAYRPFEGEPVPNVGAMNITLDDDPDNVTRDGIDKDLFPLTTDEQKQYTFDRAGERVVNGRRAYVIEFRPIKKDEYAWKGEAVIDEEEFQPVTIYTRLSRNLPFAVRKMLGTDVPGLGFNIQYARVDKDLWFPSSYGTEFGLHALFFFNRTLTESMENTNFRRTTVDSKIDFGSGADK
jgi:hypothetical protein